MPRGLIYAALCKQDRKAPNAYLQSEDFQPCDSQSQQSHDMNAWLQHIDVFKGLGGSGNNKVPFPFWCILLQLISSSFFQPLLVNLQSLSISHTLLLWSGFLIVTADHAWAMCVNTATCSLHQGCMWDCDKAGAWQLLCPLQEVSEQGPLWQDHQVVF